MQVVIFYPAFLAGYGVKVGEELGVYVGAQFELPIAMAVIIIMVALNTLGNKTTGRIQVVATVCKLVPLVLLMIFGFVLGSGDNADLHAAGRRGQERSGGPGLDAARRALCV